MSEEMARAGGCQCGAVRFRIRGELGRRSLCHCRMCQKAFGAFYAPLVPVRGAKLTWTRGTPARFKSSNFVERGFCARCGTPLTYEAPDGVAFDQPETIAHVIQFGVEGKLPYADRIASLPNRHTFDDLEAAPFLDKIVSYQHPDHDTDEWPTQ